MQKNPRVTRWSPRASRDGEHHRCQAHQGRASVGLRSEGGRDWKPPGPGQTFVLPLPRLSDLHHPSSAKQAPGCPWRRHVMLPPSPRSQPQQGPREPPTPHTPVLLPQPNCLCRGIPGACRPPQCPPRASRVRTGQGWPSARGSHRSLPLASPRQDIWSL